MKTLKYLTICFVVCCLFSSSVFAQCTTGMTVNLQGELGNWASGNGANVAAPGDVIYYTVTINRAGLCALEDGYVTLTTPDGAGGAAGIVYVLDDDLSIAAGGSETFTQDENGTDLKYTITLADLTLVAGVGSPPEASEVRAFAGINGFSVRDDGGQPQEGFAGQNFDTLVSDPEVCVTKSVECDISAPGYEVEYTILIENCGDTTLDLNSINDSLAGDLETEALAEGCGSLAPGATCEITYSLDVLQEDLLPDPNLVNEVLVVYDVNGVAGATVQDTGDEVVDLIDPSFTVEKECVDEPLMVGADANFLITIVNTGTVDLILESSEIVIEPNLLAVGETYMDNVVETVASCADVRNTIFVSATLPPELCFQLDEPLLEDASATCEVIDPNFTVEKICLTDPVPADANAMFQIVITNTSCGDVDLDFVINDPAAGIVDSLVGPIAPDTNYVLTVEIPADCNDGVVSNTVSVEAFYGDGEPISIGTKEATEECPCGGNEGCTPGFWKNHPDCWCDLYEPETQIDDVWTALLDDPYDTQKDKKSEFSADTLLDALKYGGGRGWEGATRNLLRHATAALLNGCSTGNVDYPISDALVIELVNAALATNDRSQINELHSALAGFNEDYPCPINAHCDRHDDDEVSID